MRAQLEKFGLFEKYADDFYAWKDFYAQFYYANYSRCGKKYRLETISRLLTAEPEKILSKKKSDYFYSIDTSAAAECELEKIKEKICESRQFRRVRHARAAPLLLPDRPVQLFVFRFQ